jgi:hypothetical protein
VPAVATSAIGISDALVSERITASTRSGLSRPWWSAGIATTDRSPRPSRRAALRTEKCAVEEHTMRKRRAVSVSPSSAIEAPARSRASKRPIRFDCVPPLVNTPSACGPSPYCAVSQAISRPSTCVAAGAWSHESSDWLVAETTASAASEASSGGQCRCAAHCGCATRTELRTIRRRTSSSVASRPAPSSGATSMSSRRSSSAGVTAGSGPPAAPISAPTASAAAASADV